MDQSARHYRYTEAGGDYFGVFRAGTFRAEDLQLTPFSDLKDYTFAPGDPDICGWDIRNHDDDRIGKVIDLVASAQTGDVYFLIARSGGLLASSGLGGKTVLIPLDAVALDRPNKHVLLDASKEDLENAVEWDKDKPVDYLAAYRYWEGKAPRLQVEEHAPAAPVEKPAPVRERELAGMRGGEAVAETRVPLREEELTTGREVHTGEVTIHKHVETEQRTVDVPVSHTEVEVERRAVDMTGRDVGEPAEQEIRIPISEEEVHVEKRPVVKEELVIRQHPVTETERHTETIRREVAEVGKEGDVDVDVKDANVREPRARRNRDV